MATQTQTTTGLSLYRLDVQQFEKMIEAGVFPEGVHVELLGGLLVAKMTKNPPHDYAVGETADILRGIVGRNWKVSEEKSSALGRSWMPEPDIAVIRGPRTQ